MTEHEQTKRNLICNKKNNRKGRAIFAIKKSFDDAKKFCASLNGYLIKNKIGQSKESDDWKRYWAHFNSWTPDQKKFESVTFGDPTKCGRVWIGYQKVKGENTLQLENTEGKKINAEDDQLLEDLGTKWKNGYPNGKDKKECIYIKNEDFYIRDGPCSHRYCFICDIPKYSTYLLRGYEGVRESLQETEFGLSVGQQKNASFTLLFEGLTRGKISWDLTIGKANLSFPEEENIHFQTLGQFGVGMTKWIKKSLVDESNDQFHAKFTKVGSLRQNAGIDFRKRCYY